MAAKLAPSLPSIKEILRTNNACFVPGIIFQYKTVSSAMRNCFESALPMKL